MNSKKENFKEILYEAVLYSFGITLSKYDAFSQNMMIEDAGKEIIKYLKEFGFDFEVKNTESDIMAIFEMFVKNGFTQKLESFQTPEGEKLIWHGLYGARAYERLTKVTENPFISCPLNACMLYEARKHNKYLKLVQMDFDLKNNITETIEILADGYPEISDTFNTLTLKNAKLIDIANKKHNDLEEANKEILHLANTDSLTGIMNRRAIFEITDKVCRDGSHNSILMIDIDNFKNVNDTYGHAVGDEVIKHVVQTCAKNLRVRDIFGRLGGEEFTIVLLDTGIEKAQEVALRIINEVAHKKSTDYNIKVTISIGLVDSSPNKYISFSQALKDADKALYKAKHEGKNRYIVFNSNL